MPPLTRSSRRLYASDYDDGMNRTTYADRPAHLTFEPEHLRVDVATLGSLDWLSQKIAALRAAGCFEFFATSISSGTLSLFGSLRQDEDRLRSHLIIVVACSSASSKPEMLGDTAREPMERGARHFARAASVARDA